MAALIDVAACLDVIGFTDAAERGRILGKAIATLEYFCGLNEKDIRTMAEDFARRTQADGRIVFGLSRTKRLQGILHWVQDSPSLLDIDNMEHPLPVINKFPNENNEVSESDLDDRFEYPHTRFGCLALSS